MAAGNGSALNNSEETAPRITDEKFESAQNGRRIASKLDLALIYLDNAKKALVEASKLIETGEKDPEFLMGQIPNLGGMFELAEIATRREYEEWDNIATARERF